MRVRVIESSSFCCWLSITTTKMVLLVWPFVMVGVPWTVEWWKPLEEVALPTGTQSELVENTEREVCLNIQCFTTISRKLGGFATSTETS